MDVGVKQHTLEIQVATRVNQELLVLVLCRINWVNAKDTDDVVASKIAQTNHAGKHSLSYNSLDL